MRLARAWTGPLLLDVDHCHGAAAHVQRLVGCRAHGEPVDPTPEGADDQQVDASRAPNLGLPSGDVARGPTRETI